MAGIVRKGKDTAGGLLISGSPNVFAEGYSVVRIGDSIESHGINEHVAAVMVSGSGTVIINGIPVCRAGDLASCGDAATGSSTVIAS